MHQAPPISQMGKVRLLKVHGCGTELWETQVQSGSPTPLSLFTRGVLGGGCPRGSPFPTPSHVDKVRGQPGVDRDKSQGQGQGQSHSFGSGFFLTSTGPVRTHKRKVHNTMLCPENQGAPGRLHTGCKGLQRPETKPGRGDGGCPRRKTRVCPLAPGLGAMRPLEPMKDEA